MSRPVSTDGGRPVIVSVRLSTSETEALDSLRGGLSRSQWFRRQILHAQDDHNGETDQTTPPSSVTEPTRKPRKVRGNEVEDAEVTHEGLGAHRHRPDTLLNTYYDKGTLRKEWLCGCGETLIR